MNSSLSHFTAKPITAVAGKKIQETQPSLTNRATHLCKRNDVADLTNVI